MHSHIHSISESGCSCLFVVPFWTMILTIQKFNYTRSTSLLLVSFLRYIPIVRQTYLQTHTSVIPVIVQRSDLSLQTTTVANGYHFCTLHHGPYGRHIGLFIPCVWLQYTASVLILCLIQTQLLLLLSSSSLQFISQFRNNQLTIIKHPIHSGCFISQHKTKDLPTSEVTDFEIYRFNRRCKHKGI